MITLPDFSHEIRLGGRVAGIDEVGRGPLAGPVTAAVVVLDPAAIPAGLNDSKRLSARRRDALLALLVDRAEVSLGWASVEEIDRLNIRNATFLAMTRALAGLAPVDHALIDGNALPPDLPCPATAIVKGDSKSLSIAAASIAAKVGRDAHMMALSRQFPGYGWERNAGYPTAAHKQALLDIGVSPHHRRSFKPVHNILYQDKSITS
ncbi:MAG: ribonuclease HII [Rhodobacteraceae bacterium CG17_big_fil_post_rev_8_21_14_2_50_65_11]|nr:MAG: ribonuclease HII [Rhodobacteraceae bacterium CG17_big_fil_post_rev_8_21_14_2_50_65_11]